MSLVVATVLAVILQGEMPPRESFTIESRTLSEVRTINAYTPPGYSADTSRSFPVLYMPDGGLNEDFPHIAATIDSLIRLGRIPPMLVIGIENTQRRRDLTGPTTLASDSAIAPRVGGSAAFRSFLRDELMPEVRRRYRTTSQTAIVGESLAGLFVVETFLLEPALFDRYLAVDPSLWWNGGLLVATAGPRVADTAGQVHTLYLTSASDVENAEGTSRLAAALRAEAPAGLTWYYEPRPDLAHNTIFSAIIPAAFAQVLK